MDLSLCIPVYNEEVFGLVQSLLKQARDLNLHFEVRLYDDGSQEHFLTANRSLKNEPEVQYRELPQNLGRAAIRNLMADESAGDYLFFVDCDMLMDKPDFIKTYWENRGEGVLCGGHTYQEQKPENQYLLHWMYGREREIATAAERQEQSYTSFRSSNFFSSHAVFQQVRFKEELKTYGHEDTFFAYQLKAQKVPFRAIDNTLVHNGLEESERFIQKTKNALKNLMWLREQHPEFAEGVRILQGFIKLERTATVGIMRSLYKSRKKTWLKKLTGPNPQLYTFDLFRLGYLSFISSTS